MSLSSRRYFLKALGAATALSSPQLRALDLSDKKNPFPSTAVFSNRAPLARNSYDLLPLTSVRPKGWLLEQLRIQARGLTGHLDEFWSDVGPENGWLGGTGDAWERGPYYLDGLLPLAHLLQDQTLLAKANKWVDWTLNNQAPNGMIGPSKNDDWWPRMVMLKVLTQHQEATGDLRVIPVMQRYFGYQLQELPNRPLRDWGKYRWQDEMLSVVWLYNRTGDRNLIRLAELIQQQGYNWKRQFENFTYTEKSSAKELGLAEGKPIPEVAMQTHGVNNAMALKSSALSWLFSKEDTDRSGVERQLAMLDKYHGMPTGMFSADEHFAGKNPSQGVELCAVVENMFSLEQAIAILGNAEFGDRLEKIAFNALPGTLTDDMWAHQYDQQPNQIECSLRPRPWTTNGPESNLFGLEPNFGCCTANMHQGWPKFASSLWMASAQGGLAAIAYAPCEVQTKIAGVSVQVTEDTAYPFEGEIRLQLQPERPLHFPLSLRIPDWAHGSEVKVNGKPQTSVRAGDFTVVSREWKRGDRIELTFPMKPTGVRSYHNSVVVQRGPILYSLNVQAEWTKLATKGMTADWEVHPRSTWNYAILVGAGQPGITEKPGHGPSAKSIFSLEGAPVTLEVQGEKVPQWQAENGVAGDLPQSPVSSAEPLETLSLVPYGAAKLRITVFPQVAAGAESGKKS